MSRPGTYRLFYGLLGVHLHYFYTPVSVRSLIISVQKPKACSVLVLGIIHLDIRNKRCIGFAPIAFFIRHLWAASSRRFQEAISNYGVCYSVRTSQLHLASQSKVLLSDTTLVFAAFKKRGFLSPKLRLSSNYFAWPRVC